MRMSLRVEPGDGDFVYEVKVTGTRTEFAKLQHQAWMTRRLAERAVRVAAQGAARQGRAARGHDFELSDPR